MESDVVSRKIELGKLLWNRQSFQGLLNSFTFVLGFNILSSILRKDKAAYDFAESKEKINFLFKEL